MPMMSCAAPCMNGSSSTLSMGMGSTHATAKWKPMHAAHHVPTHGSSAVNIMLIQCNLLSALVTKLHYLTNKHLLRHALLAVVHIIGTCNMLCS